MDKDTIEIRRRLVDFIKDGINKGEGIAFVMAMYGFYVSRFNKLSDLMELPEKLADELMNAGKDVREEFLDMLMELDTDTYNDLGIRVCTECGKFMHEGYYLSGDYACSDECAISLYTWEDNDREDAERRLKEDLEYDDRNCIGENYWTEF